MPEGTDKTGTEFTPITTQADLDKVIGERIARERNKFADYDAIKAKAEKAETDAAKAATDLAAAITRAETAEQSIKDYETKAERANWLTEVSTATGVPAALLRGDTKEELAAHAEAIKPLLNPGGTGVRRAVPNGVTDPDDGDSPKTAADALRRYWSRG